MKIVRIRKLDDIADNDWEITLENEGKIYHSHKDFFEIPSRGNKGIFRTAEFAIL